MYSLCVLYAIPGKNDDADGMFSSSFGIDIDFQVNVMFSVCCICRNC